MTIRLGACPLTAIYLNDHLVRQTGLSALCRWCTPGSGMFNLFISKGKEKTIAFHFDYNANMHNCIPGNVQYKHGLISKYLCARAKDPSCLSRLYSW